MFYGISNKRRIALVWVGNEGLVWREELRLSWFKQKPNESEVIHKLPLTKFRFSLANKTNDELLDELKRVHDKRRKVSISAFILVRSIFCILLITSIFQKPLSLLNISMYFMFLIGISNISEEIFINGAINVKFQGHLKGIFEELVQRKEANLLTSIDDILKDNKIVWADPNTEIYCEAIARLLPSFDVENLNTFCIAIQRLIILCLVHTNEEVRQSARRILAEHGDGKVLELIRSYHADHQKKSLSKWNYFTRRVLGVTIFYNLRLAIPGSIFLPTDATTHALFGVQLKECISLLSQRLEKENTSTTLLRASVAPQHDNELLRAVQSLPDPFPETLVRPSEIPCAEKPVGEIASNYLGEKREIQGDGTQKNLSS